METKPIVTEKADRRLLASLSFIVVSGRGGKGQNYYSFKVSKQLPFIPA
jgi:hypothetical protein